MNRILKYVFVFLNMVTVSIFFTISLNASQVYFSFHDHPGIKREIAKCDQQTGKKFSFRSIDFEEGNLTSTNAAITDSSGISGKERAQWIACINSLSFSEQEKEIIIRELQNYFAFVNSTLGIYKKWILSFDKTIRISPLELKEFQKFYTVKYDLYQLLNEKTGEHLFKKPDKIKIGDLEESFSNVYISLLKLHFEFYNSISPELRSAILGKINTGGV